MSEKVLESFAEGTFGGKRYKHESFGMVSLSRVQGTSVNLFGSSTKHSHFISLEITKAEYERSETASDYYFSRENVVTVYLSPNQFSSLLTNMNTSGVPCSIAAIDGRYLNPVPRLDSKKAQTKAEMKIRMKEFVSKFESQEAEIDELINKGRAGKADLEKVKKLLDFFKVELKSNMPFFLDQFERDMDKVVNEAKAEVEAFVQASIYSKGLTAIQNEGGLELGTNVEDTHFIELKD